MKSRLTASLFAAVLGLFHLTGFGQEPAGSVREVQVGAAQFQRGGVIPPWVEPLASLPGSSDKTSPVVGLAADTQLHVPSHASYVHRAWQVNSSSSLADVGQQSIEFNPAYQRAQLHMLRIHRRGAVIDKLASAKVSFLQREQGLEQGVYSGLVYASILVDDLRVGDALEIAYTTSGDNPVFGGRYAETASWDQGVPTELRRLTLLAPAERQIAWRLVGDRQGSSAMPQESLSGGLRRLRWEARALPRMEVENDVPGDYLPFRFLQFSEWGSWRDVTDWAHQLFTVQGDAQVGLRDVVAEIARLPSPDARAAAALAWVQNEVRYVSLSLGEGSHRPAAPLETLQRRYGDCKDKSVLLVELLRGVGIPAQPVLVSSRILKRMDRLLPAPTLFDHVIVQAHVGGRTFFLDATRIGQVGRLESLGQFWETAEVLPIVPGNEAFVQVRSPNFEAISRNELTEKIMLPKLDGPATVQVRHVLSGVAAEFRRASHAQTAPETLQKAALEAYGERYPGVRHRRPAVMHDDRDGNVVTVDMDLEVPQLAVASGSVWGVRFRPSNLYGVLRSAPSSTRVTPLALSNPRKLRYRVEVEFPPQVSKVMDPMQRVVRDPSFQYEFSMHFRGNQASATAEMEVLADRVDAARLAAYQVNLRRVGEHPFAFVVDRSDIRSTGPFGLGGASLQKTIEERLRGRVTAIARSIDSGKLRGDDLAEALCDRAEALVDLGQAEQGLKDAASAVKEAPNLARAHECRAATHFGVGEFQRAITDYTRAISLDPGNTNSYYRRGHSRYYLGQYQQALDDFVKAGQNGDPDREDAGLYSELWRLWAQKRLGLAPTSQQVEAATKQARGEWPRPALALFHDQLSVEEMLLTLDSKKGDDREMALVEGYFYAGQWHLLRGDELTAAEYFRKARDKGVTVYIEHVSAGIELARMKKN